MKRLLNFSLMLTIGVPTVMSGQATERQRPRRETDVIYLFRTLRGEVAVTLDLLIDPEALTRWQRRATSSPSEELTPHRMQKSK